MGSITLNFGQFIAAFIAAMGIPSAVMGLIIWQLERKIAKRESNAEEQAKAQEDLFLLLIQSTAAAIALGEATAKAVQRTATAICMPLSIMRRKSNISKKTFLRRRAFTRCIKTVNRR